MAKKSWRMDEAPANVPTLLVAALAGDDVAPCPRDPYREAGIDDIADDIPRRIELNRKGLAGFHHNTRRAFFRACAKHGICTVD